MPEEIDNPPRQAPRHAPASAKRYRVLTEVVYGTDPKVPPEDRELRKLKSGAIIDADLPGLNYRWCLAHGHIEEIT